MFDQRLGEPAVDVDGQVAGQHLRELGDVVTEDQLAWRRVRPAPSVMSVKNPVSPSTRRDRSATVISSSFLEFTASTSEVR
jgi:hypothetical protein